jgi:hypothetical protein
MASVTREQFKIRSELEVVHIPTGAVFPRGGPPLPWNLFAHAALAALTEFTGGELF